MARWINWLDRCPLKAEITGSSPVRATNGQGEAIIHVLLEAGSLEKSNRQVFAVGMLWHGMQRSSFAPVRSGQTVLSINRGTHSSLGSLLGFCCRIFFTIQRRSIGRSAPC